jgi:hypothetical protein
LDRREYAAVLKNTTSCLEEYARIGTGGQVAVRKLCVRNLQEKIAGQYTSYLEPMAGIGVDAQAFNADLTYVNDIDPDCLDVLRSKFPNVTSYDFFDSTERAAFYSVQPDVIFVDYNNFTLHKLQKQYRETTLDTFKAANKFVILNDCSVFALRMWGKQNYERYSRLLGVRIGTLDEYFLALVPYYLKLTGWYLTDVECFFCASPKGNGGSSYQLFRRTPRPLEVRFVTPQCSEPKQKSISAPTKAVRRDTFYSPTKVTHQTPGRYCELMGVPEVQDLQAGMDFRKPEYRREVFLRFYEFHLKYRAHPGCVCFVMPYLYKTFKWDREARLWFAFLNGNTQNPVTSWIIFQRFPNLARLKIADLDKWFNKEFTRLAFDTDRRHQKSEFMASVRCYEKLTHGEQEQFFSGFVNTEDQYENFRNAWDVVRNQFYSFGRLASFSYLEYLRIMRVNLDCDHLFLEDMKGSKSHRNGLAKVLGRDDLDWHDSNPTEFDGKYTPEMLVWLNKEAALLLNEARNRVAGQPYANDVSYFTLESTFCTYKSWHRPNRRYPGVYADIFHDRIKKAEAAWPKEDFSIFWDARKSYLPEYLRLEDNPGDPGLKPEKQNHYRLTGQVIMMDTDWSCFANSFRKSSKAASAQ